jgi:hypothetical protein
MAQSRQHRSSPMESSVSISLWLWTEVATSAPPETTSTTMEVCTSTSAAEGVAATATGTAAGSAQAPRWRPAPPSGGEANAVASCAALVVGAHTQQATSTAVHGALVWARAAIVLAETFVLFELDHDDRVLHHDVSW